MEPRHLTMAELPERVAVLEERLKNMGKNVADIDGKMDQLLQAAAMGRGAWILLLKLGGVVTAIAAVAGWLYDHFFKQG